MQATIKRVSNGYVVRYMREIVTQDTLNPKDNTEEIYPLLDDAIDAVREYLVVH